MDTVLVTGATGTIGKAIVHQLLAAHYRVHILSRTPQQTDTGVHSFQWDIEGGYLDPKALAGVDHIIHLAGAGVADQRWSTKRKKEIRESRVKGGELLSRCLQEMPHQVKTLVSASAIGWYEETPPFPEGATVTRSESAPPDSGFLGETCRAWEESLSGIPALGIRLVILRTGIVLSAEGGAYVEFVKPVRMGVAAILGSGKQYISWIHVQDMVRMYLFALQTPSLSGVYNAVAPKPVTNEVLTLAIAKAIKGKLFVPIHVPAFLLQWIMGEMSTEVLKSVQVCADKIRKAGFTFDYPDIHTSFTHKGFMDL
jgi:uncharacterized protein (TIGR01777 family)